MKAAIWLALALAIGTNAQSSSNSNQCRSCDANKPLATPIAFVIDRIDKLDLFTTSPCVACSIQGLPGDYTGSPNTVFPQLTFAVKDATANGKLRASTRIMCNSCNTAQQDAFRRCPKLLTFVDKYIADARNVIDRSVSKMSNNATRNIIIESSAEEMNMTVAYIKNKLEAPMQTTEIKPSLCENKCNGSDPKTLEEFQQQMKQLRSTLIENMMTIKGAPEQAAECTAKQISTASRALTNKFKKLGCVVCNVVYKDEQEATTDVAVVDTSGEAGEGRNFLVTIFIYIGLGLYNLLYYILRGLVKLLTFGYI